MIPKTVLVVLIAILACAKDSPLVVPGDEGFPMEDGDCLYYGDNYFFMLKRPTGWGLDTQSGRAQGIDGIFFPPGGSVDGPVSGYARAFRKKRGMSFDDVLAKDFADYQQSSSDVSYMENPAEQTRDGRIAMIRQCSAYGGQVHELVAYIDEALVVALVVLRAPDASTLERLTPTFLEVVRSYRAPMRGKEPFSIQ